MVQAQQVLWRKKGKILQFKCRGQWHTVREALDRWKDVGEWWDGEAPKLFVRLLTDSGVWELYRDLTDGRWFFYRRYD